MCVLIIINWMTDLTVNIIFRKSAKYLCIDNYIQNVSLPVCSNFIIYDCTMYENDTEKPDIDNLISNIKNKIRYFNITDKSVLDLRKKIYNSVKSNESILILDSCLNYLSYEIKNNDKNQYLLIEKDKLLLPYIYYYNSKNDFLSEDDFIKLTRFNINSDINNIKLNIDSFFIKNYFCSIDYLTLDYLILDYFSNNLLITKYNEFLIDELQNKDIKLFLYQFNNNICNFYETCALKFNSTEKQVVRFLQINHYINNDVKSVVLLNNYNNYYKLWILFNLYPVDSILNYCVDNTIDIMDRVDKNISNSVFYIEDKVIEDLAFKLLSVMIQLYSKLNKNIVYNNIPKWIKIYNFDILDEYFDNIIVNSEKCNLNCITLSKNLKLYNKNKFLIDEDKILDIKDNIITFNNKKIIKNENFCLLQKNSTSELHNNNLIMVSINPIKFISIDNCSEIIINKIAKFYYKSFIGNFIYICNKYISLIRCSEKSYLFIIVNYDLTDVNYSEKIFIEDKNIVGLLNSDDNVYIISFDNGIYVKHLVDITRLYTEFISDISPKSIVNLNIKKINNILLSIPNYDNILSEYKLFTYNLNQPSIGKFEYEIDKRILKFKKNYYYHNKFIYLPSKTKVHEKQFDIFIDDSVSNELVLINMITNSGYSIGNDINLCKYLIISQQILESYSSLELSLIIDNETLIISLLENDEIENDTFIKTYTSDKLITKLFLFNIAKNDSYVSFILENILADNQYQERKQYMKIDKENIFTNSNIYNLIESILNKKKRNNFIIKLTDDNNEILHNIINKWFSGNNNFEKLIKYIIFKKFNANISSLDNSIIPENIEKINFLGNNICYNKINEPIIDIFFIKNKNLLTNLFIEKKNILIFDIDNQDTFTT